MIIDSESEHANIYQSSPANLETKGEIECVIYNLIRRLTSNFQKQISVLDYG